MVLIGELINSTRKQVDPILRSRDEAALVELARRQVEAGAPILEVNCATLLEDEARCMAWAVRTIQGALEARISLDSPNPEAIRRGLEVHRGRAMVNAINLERDRWQRLLPLIQEYRPEVVATCIDEGGMPRTAERKRELAVRLVEGLLEAGVPAVQALLGQDPYCRHYLRAAREGRLDLSRPPV
ncbi:MAG: dihydropteroate synthase [Armatimonadetes bacterium]|nr:dihydropteroate synthase [Armatimonadota bacterium]MDW8154045.1 dihydropteroate synthase [Armatimonadota bacterium]